MDLGILEDCKSHAAHRIRADSVADLAEFESAAQKTRCSQPIDQPEGPEV